MAPYRYMTNRITSLPLTTTRKNEEWQKILTIAHSKTFPSHLISKLNTQIQYQKHANKTNNKSDKWATFNYYSSKVRNITDLFKHTDVKIAFKCRNKIQQKIRH
jgi:hypothetical protein